MRSFSGSGGAVYLLGDPVTGGASEPWRPRALIAQLRRWHMQINDLVMPTRTLDGGGVQYKPGDTTLTLEPETVTDLPLEPGDELLVTMPFMFGEIQGVAPVTAHLAIQRRDGPLLIDDLKEVEYVQ